MSYVIHPEHVTLPPADYAYPDYAVEAIRASVDPDLRTQITFFYERVHAHERCEYLKELRRDSPTLPIFTFTFVASRSEIDSWHLRESRRFTRGEYTGTPWQHLPLPDACVAHYAHLSITEPGKIAYTASPEHGLQDRQTRVRPGRYLEQFYGHLSHEERQRYIHECAERVTTYAITRTPDETEWVYQHGPGSCMDGTHHFSLGHPTRVYAEPGDLRVAYWPDSAMKNDGKVSQRVVIWPDKKYYGRIYGDGPLARLLERDGYTCKDYFIGARVPAIEAGSGYLMPYVDVADYAELDDAGEWFTFTRHDGIGVKETCGVIYHDGEDPTCTCERCNDTFTPDDDTPGPYCYSCEQERRCCDSCNEDFFPSSGGVVLSNGTAYCDDCEGEHRSVCAMPDCDETWHESEVFSRTQMRQRASEGLDAFCEACAPGATFCEDCAEWYDAREQNHCPSCGPDDADDLDVQPTPEPALYPNDRWSIRPDVTHVCIEPLAHADIYGYRVWLYSVDGNREEYEGVTLQHARTFAAYLTGGTASV